MGEILWVTQKTESKDQINCSGKADGGAAALLLTTDLDYRLRYATLNLLAAELFFLILAHPVYKM